MSKYTDSIDRLEKATGPDRELDALICVASDDRPDWADGYGPLWFDGFTARINNLHPNKPSPGNPTVGEIKHYTASIDAAIALVERMMKTYSLSMGIDPSGNGASLVIWPNGFSGYTELGPYEGCATSLPVAILLALFRALEAKEQAA